MIYTLLGYFGMNPIMDGRNITISQDFYRTDSDCPKDRCSQSSPSQVLHWLELLWICLVSVSCTFTVQSYGLVVPNKSLIHKCGPQRPCLNVSKPSSGYIQSLQNSGSCRRHCLWGGEGWREKSDCARCTLLKPTGKSIMVAQRVPVGSCQGRELTQKEHTKSALAHPRNVYQGEERTITVSKHSL